MLFLLQYDPPTGSLLTFKKFESADMEQARTERLALELDLNSKGLKHEVVILESSSEETLRDGYKRYFSSWEQLSHPDLPLALPTNPSKLH